MTTFQRDAADALQSTLRRHEKEVVLLECFSQHVVRRAGGREMYLTGQMNLGERVLRLFIYADELGFFLDQQWFPFERVDYDSEEQMITRFTEAIEAQLQQGFGSSAL